MHFIRRSVILPYKGVLQLTARGGEGGALSPQVKCPSCMFILKVGGSSPGGGKVPTCGVRRERPSLPIQHTYHDTVLMSSNSSWFRLVAFTDDSQEPCSCLVIGGPSIGPGGRCVVP